MSHRPYPNADRALHQLDRHDAAHPALHFLLPSTERLFAGAVEAVQAFGLSLAEKIATATPVRPDEEPTT